MKNGIFRMFEMLFFSSLFYFHLFVQGLELFESQKRKDTPTNQRYLSLAWLCVVLGILVRLYFYNADRKSIFEVSFKPNGNNLIQRKELLNGWPRFRS